MEFWIPVVILFIISIALISALVNPWLPIWFCRVMHWHLAPKEQGFDGCSFNGTCPRCGKSVLRDSQGNWF